jgi:hypothetical protein
MMVVAVNSLASVMAISLVELVNYSDLVVEGEIISVRPSPIKSEIFGSAEIVNMEISDKIRGELKESKLEVLTFPQFSDSPRTRAGMKAVVFLARCDNYFEPILGYRGLVSIDRRDRVFTSNILGEPREQSLLGFKKRIRNAEVLPTLLSAASLEASLGFRCFSKARMESDGRD